MVIGVVLIVGVLAVLVVPILLLRNLGQSQLRLEDELHDPSVRTVAYHVPAGRDPVELMTVARLAGYRGIEDSSGTLLIACPNPDDPDNVRRLLDNA